jgi:hypothetical protein
MKFALIITTPETNEAVGCIDGVVIADGTNRNAVEATLRAVHATASEGAAGDTRPTRRAERECQDVVPYPAVARCDGEFSDSEKAGAIEVPWHARMIMYSYDVGDAATTSTFARSCLSQGRSFAGASPQDRAYKLAQQRADARLLEMLNKKRL